MWSLFKVAAKTELKKFYKKHLDLFILFKAHGRTQSNELSIYISYTRKLDID